MIAGNICPLNKECRLCGTYYIFRCDPAFSDALGNIKCLVCPIRNSTGCIAFAIDTNANREGYGQCKTGLDIVQGIAGG